MTLIEAIQKLETKHLLKVTMIEYEDGSGNKFNYKLANGNKLFFADLTQEEIPWYGHPDVWKIFDKK
jgi:hypothetical protein